MIKKILSIFIIITAFIFTFTNLAQATTLIAPHWQKSPITVYIPKDDNRAITMRHAFEKWQKESFGNLKFSFVDKGPADIDVVFTDNVDGSDGPIASYSLTIRGKSIERAEIKIATKGSEIKKYSKNYIYTTMLHEVGHALGLQDTNRKKNSIMYMPVSETQELLKLDMRNLYNLNNWSWMDRRISD